MRVAGRCAWLLLITYIILFPSSDAKIRTRGPSFFQTQESTC